MPVPRELALLPRELPAKNPARLRDVTPAIQFLNFAEKSAGRVARKRTAIA
jgi:hypothetical protein